MKKISDSTAGFLIVGSLVATAYLAPSLILWSFGIFAIIAAYKFGKVDATEKVNEQHRLQRFKERGECTFCGAVLASMTACAWKNCVSGLSFNPEAPNKPDYLPPVPPTRHTT